MVPILRPRLNDAKTAASVEQALLNEKHIGPIYIPRFFNISICRFERERETSVWFVVPLIRALIGGFLPVP